MENSGSVGRHHVEFAQRFVIWWWIIQFHHWIHMIYILIMQLRGASFILRMKSRVLLHNEIGMIIVSICLHGVISWSRVSGHGQFGPTKTVITEKKHPSVLKFCLTWTVYNISNKMTKFFDDVYPFEPVRRCQFLKLYIAMFEKWLESPQWLLAVSKPKVRMHVTSAWGQEFPWKIYTWWYCLYMYYILKNHDTKTQLDTNPNLTLARTLTPFTGNGSMGHLPMGVITSQWFLIFGKLMHNKQCTRKTLMVHQTFVRWTLYIFYSNLWNLSSDIWA